MKYKDLPSLELIEKLKGFLTGDSQKDNKLFFYCLSVEPSAKFLEQQRIKLVEKYGVPEGMGYKVKQENLEAFAKEFTEALEMEVKENVKPFPIPSDLSWFDSEDCVYSKNKELWLNFNDKKFIMELAKKEEKQGI